MGAQHLGGLFITFEGGEGAGKTTLIQALKDELTKQAGVGMNVVCTREPGGTPAGEDIRNLLVNGPVGRWDAVSETALFLSARRQHVRQLIEPALKNGSMVLCDRFSDSTLVYQGIAKKLGVEYVSKLSELIVGDIRPDITFLIDIDPAQGLARTSMRNEGEGRFEAHGLAFHQLVREGFLSLAKASPERMVVIDGGQSAADVLKAVKAHLDAYIT